MTDFPPAQETFPVIANRHGLRVFVKLLMVSGSQRNAYLVHGYSDVHDTPHMRALTGALVDAGYNVIVWDASHSWGRSEGARDTASFYYHQEDLEDVVAWSQGQSWYRSQFTLAGHSLGGMAAGVYAAAHAATVERLIMVAPVVSGSGLRWRVLLPVSLWPRRWGHARALLHSAWAYNLLRSAHRLTMPVLLVGAGRDILMPPRLVRRLFQALPVQTKTLEIVPRARHNFDRPWEMERLQQLVGEWLRAAD